MTPAQQAWRDAVAALAQGQKPQPLPIPEITQ